MIFAFTIFLSAFLLFQVQPMIGKFVLPWFGGTPAVWTTCLLFFQVLLLAGYTYAHLLVRLGQRAQLVVHGTLLAIAVVSLPITPSDQYRLTGDQDPVPGILLTLTLSVGLPYLLLATTGPLLQSWYHRATQGRTPYRLYAVSNAGSLLALLSYPFLMEPLFRLKVQAWMWSSSFVVFAICCAVAGWQQSKAGAVLIASQDSAEPPEDSGQARAVENRALNLPSPDLDPIDMFLWLGLSACGTTMLMATTNRLCQDVASVPFLWILPLSLYLITFIICFDKEKWYFRPFFIALLVASAPTACLILSRGVNLILINQIVCYSTILFACCMACHGELVRRKPPPRRLTLFYLLVSAGGCLGGLFVALIAPRVFQGFWEFHLGLVLTCVLVLIALVDDLVKRSEREELPSLLRGNRGVLAALVPGMAGIVGLIWYLSRDVSRNFEDTLRIQRNFYGVLRVQEEARDNLGKRRDLVHGGIIHGFQYDNVALRAAPTSYFGRLSGVGLAMTLHPTRRSGRPLRMGIVGLGTGTLAAYANGGDYMRFYEINPLVRSLSSRYFTYTGDARRRRADLDIFMGDARTVMQAQLRNRESQRFDVLAIDAFSSDAIPLHLLTRECFGIYWRQLRPDGILAVHISNRHLDLSPVVRKLAEASGRIAALVENTEERYRAVYSSSWILVTNNRTFLSWPPVRRRIKDWTASDKRPILWTDDFSSLFPVLK